MKNKVLLKNKHYHECTKCGAPIIHDKDETDSQKELIPLNLDGKRHHCTGTELILAEENILKEIQRIINYANKIELTSFQLRIILDVNDAKSDRATRIEGNN
jgi:hypothetical protein